MQLNSKDLKQIIDTIGNSKMPVRVYTSYNMYTVIKMVVNKGRLIIFTGEADNLEPVEYSERLVSMRPHDNEDYDDDPEPPMRA